MSVIERCLGLHRWIRRYSKVARAVKVVRGFYRKGVVQAQKQYWGTSTKAILL